MPVEKMLFYSWYGNASLKKPGRERYPVVCFQAPSYGAADVRLSQLPIPTYGWAYDGEYKEPCCGISNSGIYPVWDDYIVKPDGQFPGTVLWTVYYWDGSKRSRYWEWALDPQNVHDLMESYGV